LYGDNRWVSGLVALVMFLALPGMFVGWFVGQWIGDTRWPWWSAVLGAIAITVIAARLTVISIAWNSGDTSSVGDSFVRLFQFAGFWWNVVTVPLVTLIGFGLSRDAA
jgi:hypothetical protein